jgi:hypothetical protein
VYTNIPPCEPEWLSAVRPGLIRRLSFSLDSELGTLWPTSEHGVVLLLLCRDNLYGSRGIFTVCTIVAIDSRGFDISPTVASPPTGCASSPSGKYCKREVSARPALPYLCVPKMILSNASARA